MKTAGLTENEINKAYDYFDERASTLFDRPNMHNLTGLPQLREEQRDSSESEDNEDDEKGEHDTSRQSAGTTRASESHMKPRLTWKSYWRTTTTTRIYPILSLQTSTTRKSPTSTPWHHRYLQFLLLSPLDTTGNGNMSTLSTQAAC
eukprot:1738219-Amphidinium_carterae.1